MTEVDAGQLKDAIETQHGGTATLVQAVPVKETFEGQPVWEGVVHVFDVNGGVKAGHWGGVKTGQRGFASWAQSSTHRGRPGGDGQGFAAGGGHGFQEAMMISPVSGSAAAMASSAGRGSRRRRAFECLSR